MFCVKPQHALSRASLPAINASAAGTLPLTVRWQTSTDKACCLRNTLRSQGKNWRGPQYILWMAARAMKCESGELPGK